ncbi:unnamed protein product [Caenorhabditis auriculariae]|uniref:HIT-type domain-containing protein n=1 Tax=Caenorhabditis auriculariae TaxID=2777116 RepID=A0A8S1GYY4_9PELO|nr:unnamed protein product [Caenorhabditis auriculariae]
MEEKYATCGVCGIEKKGAYKCPRCSQPYCSIKCYRNEKHGQCSEGFYKERVKDQLKGQFFEQSTSDADANEKLRKYMSGDWSDIPEGEALDSDDDAEAEKHAQTVFSATMQDYSLDDKEIERRLVALGLSEDPEELMKALTEDERAAFVHLAQSIEEEEYEQSCFRKS